MSSIIDRLLETQNTQDTLRDEDCYAETQCDSTQADEEQTCAVSKIRSRDSTSSQDVCTTDEDVETTASEGEEKENLKIYAPSEADLGIAEADIAAGCNAEPGTPVQDSKKELRREDLELYLRQLGGLSQHQALHPPPPRSFARQVDAISCLEGLLAQGSYELHQVALFSREFTSTGCRRFLVDTKVGFALASAPSPKQAGQNLDRMPQQHLYEVLMERQPCWLYFDLEFPRCVNPNLDPGKVISAFYDLLNEFCRATFRQQLDASFLFELDSTTEEKFSKHVIAKRLRPGCDDGQYHCETLAFASNAQVGFFVRKFMDFVREQRLAALLELQTVVHVISCGGSCTPSPR